MKDGPTDGRTYGRTYLHLYLNLCFWSDDMKIMIQTVTDHETVPALFLHIHAIS